MRSRAITGSTMRPWEGIAARPSARLILRPHSLRWMLRSSWSRRKVREPLRSARSTEGLAKPSFAAAKSSAPSSSRAEDRLRIAHFEKLCLWTGDFAVVSAAVSAVTGQQDRCARVVFGALGPTPWRARKTERALDGDELPSAVLERLDDELSMNGHPLKNNAWKLDAAHGLARRAMEALSAIERPYERIGERR